MTYDPSKPTTAREFVYAFKCPNCGHDHFILSRYERRFASGLVSKVRIQEVTNNPSLEYVHQHGGIHVDPCPGGLGDHIVEGDIIADSPDIEDEMMECSSCGCGGWTWEEAVAKNILYKIKEL